jgi:hypothetical protein
MRLSSYQTFLEQFSSILKKELNSSSFIKYTVIKNFSSNF